MATLLQLLLHNTLTQVVFFPAVACIPLLFFRKDSEPAVRIYALLASLLQLALTIGIVAQGFAGNGGFRIVEDGVAPIEWIRTYGVRYQLAMDGISMPLVLLTSILLPIVLLGSWRGIDKHWKGFAASLFLLTTGILGALMAGDLFLFYIFWELMLVPMYLLIGIWGGERRIYAAVKFFLFTMAGSLLMLVAIVYAAWSYRTASGEWSFAYEALLKLDFPIETQIWLFGAFALAFAIKVPMFPLHTWLPDAHVEAPTGGSVILAGILLKLGTYGFLRFAIPMFPHAAVQATPLLMTLAVIGIIYGALVAWAQQDMKKLVAYSSVAHLGFVMMGLLALDLLAWQGSLIQMVNHGLSTGALFLLVGMLYDRRHTKLFAEFGGLAKVMPWFAFFLVFSSLASVGLPGLNGFVGEFLILTGTFRAGSVLAAVVGAFGVILAAVYLLKMILETIWGPLSNEKNRQLEDLSLREILIMAPLCLVMLIMGVAPNIFLKPSEPALSALLSNVHTRLAEPLPQSEVEFRSVPDSVPTAAIGIHTQRNSSPSEVTP